MGNQINGTNINQALQVAMKAFRQIQSKQGIASTTNIDFKTLRTTLGAFQDLATRLPNLKAIPEAQGFFGPVGPLAGVNSMLTSLQAKYHLRIPGSEQGTSAENLAAIFTSGNQPLTQAEARAQDFFFLSNYNQAERTRRADPSNDFDQEAINALQQEIEEIQKSQNEDNSSAG